MLRRLAACTWLLVSSCRPTPEPQPPSSAPTTSASQDATNPATTGASELPAGVVAIVDDVEIRDEDVTALAAKLEREEVASGGEPFDADARAGLRRWLVGVMIYAELLRHEAARLGVEPESRDAIAVVAFVTRAENGDPDLGWIDDEHAMYEVAVARGLGLLDVDDAALAAAYEKRKPRWTSATPWVEVELESIPWQEPSGVAACDEYVNAYHHCIDHEIPKAAQRPMMAALDASARAFQESARDREKHDGLAVACGAARDAAVQSTGSLCDWTKPPPRGAAGKALAKREANARRKIMMRSPPTTVESPAFETGGPHEIVSLDELPSPLAKLAKVQPLGRVSAPIAHDRAFWLVRVVRRWPAGALPLDAVRATLEVEVATERLESAHDELPKRLRASHRVLVRAPAR